MGKLKASHCAALVARRDFKALKGFSKHGAIVDAAAWAGVPAESSALSEKRGLAPEEAKGASDSPPAATDLVPACMPEKLQTPEYGCMPMYYNWFTISGEYVGTFFHGYQVFMPVESTVFVAPPVAQPGCQERLTWSIPAREAQRLFHGGPPTMHLGVADFRGLRYSLDLAAFLEASGDDVFQYHAALKRIGGSHSQVVMISFDGSPPVHHDFAHHVYISPLLTTPRETLQEAEGRFSLSVSMSLF